MGLILAAGTGTRMGNNTTPKCLLNLDGISIIEYQLQCFKKFGINDIVVVVGFNSEMIKKRIGTDVKYVNNLNFHCFISFSCGFVSDDNRYAGVIARKNYERRQPKNGERN